MVVSALSLRYIYAEATIDAALYDLDRTDITDFAVEGEISKELSQTDCRSIQEMK